MNKSWALALAGATALGAAAAAPIKAHPNATPVKYATALDSAAQIPAPNAVPARAAAQFSATLTGGDLKMTLSYANLSSRAITAMIRFGGVGKAGGALIPLCGPCRSPITETANPTAAEIQSLEAGKTYIVIATTKNPSGEIRGQITVTP